MPFLMINVGAPITSEPDMFGPAHFQELSKYVLVVRAGAPFGHKPFPMINVGAPVTSEPNIFGPAHFQELSKGELFLRAGASFWASCPSP